MTREKRPNYPPADGLLSAEQHRLISRPHILLRPVERVRVECGSGDIGEGRGEGDDVAVAERGGAKERRVTATEDNGGVTEINGGGGKRRRETVEGEEVRERGSHVK